MNRRRAAFTLFEMILVVAIFVLLAGGIYGTVNAAIRATATLNEENIEAQRLNAFVALVRRTLHNLPATARVSGGVRRESGDGLVELVIEEAPGAFAWGTGGPSSGTAVLAARPRLGGGREMSLLLLPGATGEMERRELLERGAWLRLLPDLRSVQWRFFDEGQQDWVDEWSGGGRPPLVELTLELLGEGVPRRFTFWVPPVQEMDFEAAAPEERPGAPAEEEPE